jgi:hypothetical protein
VKRLGLIVAALAIVAAAPAYAFFFEATDQPLTLHAATPQSYVVNSAGTGTVDLGEAAEWTETFKEAFTLDAQAQLPGDGAVAIALETDGPVDATLRSMDGDPIMTIAELGKARVDLDVDPAAGDGDHTATVTVRMTFADGSTMRYVVPIAWTDL